MILKNIPLWTYPNAPFIKTQITTNEHYQADKLIVDHGRPSHAFIVDKLLANKHDFVSTPLYVRYFTTYDGIEFVHTSQVVGVIDTYLILKGNPYYEQDHTVYFSNTVRTEDKIVWLSPDYEKAYGKVSPYHELLETDSTMDILLEVFFYRESATNKGAKRILMKEGDE